MILIREISPVASRFGTVAESTTTPSTRKRTRRSPPLGSRWMSEVPRLTASAISVWTSLTTGASSADSRSSISGSGSSSSSVAMSTSSTESINRESWPISASRSSGVVTIGRTLRSVAIAIPSSPNRLAGSAVATSSMSSSTKAIGIAR